MGKLAIFSTFVTASTAFAPSLSNRIGCALYSTADATADDSMPLAAINGWVPDENEPCFGLPGAIAPTGFFDPLGFAQDGIGLNEIKRNREAEVMHGRVAMVASVGYLAGEAVSGPFHI